MSVTNKEGILMFRSLPRKGFLGFEFEGKQEYAM